MQAAARAMTTREQTHTLRRRMMFAVQRIDGKDIELICRAESELWAETVRDLLDSMGDEDVCYVVAKENTQ